MKNTKKICEMSFLIQIQYTHDHDDDNNNNGYWMMVFAERKKSFWTEVEE